MAVESTRSQRQVLGWIAAANTPVEDLAVGTLRINFDQTISQWDGAGWVDVKLPAHCNTCTCYG